MEPLRRHGSVLLPVLLGMLVFGGGSAAVYALAVVARCVGQLHAELRQAQGLDAGSMAMATEVFDRHGAKIGELGGERRYYVKLPELPRHVVQAFLSAEDKDFYYHWGLDPVAVARSVVVNLRGRAFRQGASTITQQLARVSFLDGTKSIERKVKEAILALAIERRLKKDDILELYLNKIYLGHRSYGIESAARNYFRKHAAELTIGEAAMLAGLPKAPSRYAPHRNAKRASERQAFVLRRMAEDGFITKAEAKEWEGRVVRVATRPEQHGDKAPYFVQAVESEVERKLGYDGLPRSGLRIHTTLDLGLQRAARQALAQSIRRLSKSAKASVAIKGRIEGAVFSLDPNTGAVLAMQGGLSYELSQFNRSLHSRRRLGMAFAPVFLSLAFEKGFALTSPVGKDPLSGGRARPSLDDDTIYRSFLEGRLEGLVPVYAALGGGTVVQHARRLGFDFERDDVTVALGYGEASAAQVARAFASFENGGSVLEPFLVSKVESRDGRVLYRAKAAARDKERVLSPGAAYVTRHLLQDKLAGDARGLTPPAPQGAGGLAAATDDLHDAWFAGSTGRLTSAVWIGAETGQARLAESQASAAREALALWSSYMRAAPVRYRDGRPGDTLPPPSVSFVRLPPIGADTGQRLNLPFVAGTEPRERRGASRLR
jgi:penicillin-binding protein 1A